MIAAAAWRRLLAIIFLLQYAALGVAQALLLFDPRYAGGDFFLDYEAAQRVLSGAGAYFPPQGYFRPPFGLTYVAPLTLHSPEAALLLRRITDGAFYFASLVVTLYIAGAAGARLGSRSMGLRLVALWAFSLPFLHGLFSGQTNGLLLLCTLSAWLLWQRRRFGWAGLALAPAALTKVFPLFLALVWLRKGHYPMLAWSALGLLAGAAATVVLLGPRTTLEFMLAAPSATAMALAVSPGNFSLSSAAALLASWLWPPGQAVAATIGRGVSLLALFLGPALLPWRSEEDRAPLELAFALALMVVAGQLVEYHHLIFLMPAATLLLLASDGHWPPTGSWPLLAGGLELIQLQPLLDLLGGFPVATAGYLLVAAACWRTLRAAR
ncbi:MAG: DUF2029 domain-containing protein [Chloroflexi bacterium]|nr:DUF2029 domain-containing protein [Chloroflexota bacterium]